MSREGRSPKGRVSGFACVKILLGMDAQDACTDAGGTIPWMESVESSLEQRPRKRLEQVFERRLHGCSVCSERAGARRDAYHAWQKYFAAWMHWLSDAIFRLQVVNQFSHIYSLSCIIHGSR